MKGFLEIMGLITLYVGAIIVLLAIVIAILNHSLQRRRLRKISLKPISMVPRSYAGTGREVMHRTDNRCRVILKKCRS